MKRKVKFQEGGAVGGPAPRPARETARARQLREMMERFGREGRRVRTAERMREEQVARRETARRAGAPDFTTDPEGRSRPSASRALAEVATPRQMPLGRVRPPVGGNLATIVGGTAAAAVEPMVDYGRRFMERRGAEADARRELNLRSMGARTADAEGGDIAADAERQRQEAARPAPRPAPRPAASRPAAAPAPRPRIREATADELNEMELRRIRAERQMEEDDARERRRGREEEMMGGSGNIGAASARERGEQVGPPGDYNNFRKGGMVKPKKMMKGGVVSKPKAGAKAKAKPMPAFKKGGMIKKGKK